MTRKASAVLMMVLCMLLAFDGADGQSKKKGKKSGTKSRKKSQVVKATGALSVTKDENGKVTGVEFAGDEGTYNVLIGKSGAKFAKLDGKTVDIVGMLTEKDGETLLRIGKCREKKEKKEPKPKKEAEE